MTCTKRAEQLTSTFARAIGGDAEALEEIKAAEAAAALLAQRRAILRGIADDEGIPDDVRHRAERLLASFDSERYRAELVALIDALGGTEEAARITGLSPMYLQGTRSRVHWRTLKRLRDAANRLGLALDFAI